MRYEDIYDAVANIPNGRFFKVCYRTEVPLLAKYKNAGYHVYKYTSRVTRTGVAYNNLESVRSANKQFSRSSKSSWLIPNKIKTNLNTGKDYLIIAPMLKNEHKAYSYAVTDNTGCKIPASELPKHMIPESYFRKTNGAIRNINLDNIIFISYKGEVIYGNANIS